MSAPVGKSPSGTIIVTALVCVCLFAVFILLTSNGFFSFMGFASVAELLERVGLFDPHIEEVLEDVGLDPVEFESGPGKMFLAAGDDGECLLVSDDQVVGVGDECEIRTVYDPTGQPVIIVRQKRGWNEVVFPNTIRVLEVFARNSVIYRFEKDNSLYITDGEGIPGLLTRPPADCLGCWPSQAKLSPNGEVVAIIFHRIGEERLYALNLSTFELAFYLSGDDLYLKRWSKDGGILYYENDIFGDELPLMITN